mmetsp:Transcript_85519/g.266150  ORF Transcript_85519/g.266150 Transcript_85519/m.266150 type:complete len:201 (-) Transcript_85519:652-1254(-)
MLWPVRSASTMSMRASGCCSSSGLCTRPRPALPAKVSRGPGSFGLGRAGARDGTGPRPRAEAGARASSKPSAGAPPGPGAASHGASRPAPAEAPPNVECAKPAHAVSSLLTQSAASCRTLPRGMGWASWPPGLCSGGSVGASPARGLGPSSSSASLKAARRTAAGGAFVSFCDFSRTASQFLPSATDRGWSSPKHLLATW